MAEVTREELAEVLKYMLLYYRCDSSNDCNCADCRYSTEAKRVATELISRLDAEREQEGGGE
jgi:hypothetical protein